MKDRCYMCYSDNLETQSHVNADGDWTYTVGCTDCGAVSEHCEDENEAWEDFMSMKQ